MIRVIEQTTQEREEETKELFEKIRPLLDKNYIYSKAVIEVLGLKRKPYYTNGWYRDLIKYGESQGYDYKDYCGRRKK